jgi:aspartokinase
VLAMSERRWNVQKFGGTSVSCSDAFQKCAKIIEDSHTDRLVCGVGVISF